MKFDKVIIAGVAIIAILAVLLVLAGACGFCMFCGNLPTSSGSLYPIEHREDKTSHAGAAKVSIDGRTFGGNIEVVEATGDTIEVTYYVSASKGRLGDVVTNTTYALNGDTLNIKATARLKDDSDPFTGTRGARLTIAVPKNASYSLDLSTAGGNVDVAELSGRSLLINTAGGNIDVAGGNYATLTAHTAGGNVYATYNATDVDVDTLGGNVILTAGQTTGSLTVNTMGGNIHVKLPKDTKLSLDASTLGGQISHGSIPLVTTQGTRSHVTGQTEGGSGTLDIVLHSIGGNLEISYLD